jgi:signal transduction histidine kinase
MPDFVPESTSAIDFAAVSFALELALDSVLELTRADCGWVALTDPVAGLTFPVRRGPVPDSWLDYQAGRQRIWGVAVRDGPTLLNDLAPWPGFSPAKGTVPLSSKGQSPTPDITRLKNLLSCPIYSADRECGQVVVANKSAGFSSHDATIAQGIAHVIGKLVDRARSLPDRRRQMPVLLAEILNPLPIGVLVVDSTGLLVFANTTWVEWTGFSLGQLLFQRAPFSFWVDHRQMAALKWPEVPASLRAQPGRPPTEALPFRHVDGTIFWCQVESRRLAWNGGEWTAACLHGVDAAHQSQPGALATGLAQLVANAPASDWTSRQMAARPTADWLALLVLSGHETAWWDERWIRFTGLKSADVAGVPVETVLDWLFPLQSDRDFVADLLHSSKKPREGAQAVLHVLSPEGRRPLLCTFLPIGVTAPAFASAAAAKTAEAGAWLLLVGELGVGGLPTPQKLATEVVQEFARGLSHLLNHYLATPIGVAEAALDREDLPAPVAASFEQILEGCRPAAHLIAALRDLAAVAVGETTIESCPTLIQEVLDEMANENLRDYDLITDFSEPNSLVRVNRRMMLVVLRHLLVNAEQSLRNCPERRIVVRVRPQGELVCCEIEDSGEGFATPELTGAIRPFYSTKGPFARDSAHAALPGVGLGLTVSQHLLALNGGRLELISRPGHGTTATVFLPRAILAPAVNPAEAVRVDPAGETRGPHAASGLPAAAEPHG